MSDAPGLLPLARIAQILANVGADPDAPGEWHLDFARAIEREAMEAGRRAERARIAEAIERLRPTERAVNWTDDMTAMSEALEAVLDEIRSSA